MNELEEKVLFQGEVVYKRNYFLLAAILFGVGLLSMIICIIVASNSYWAGFPAIFDPYNVQYNGGFGFLVWFFLSIGAMIAGIVLIFLNNNQKGTFSVTNKRVDFKVTVKRLPIFKEHDYEVFFPCSTIKVVEASKNNKYIIVKGERETIRFEYLDGALDVLASVLP